MKFQHGFAPLALSIVACVGGAADGGNDNGANAPATAGQPSALSDAERDDLSWLREEEKLARDVYTALVAPTKVMAFDRIRSSEQSHMDAVLVQLQKHGLPDPVGSNGPGVFTDAALQQVYNDLLADASRSVDAAVEVGALIEDLDLHDIATMRTHTTNPSLLALYDNLACGSRNHLRSFTQQLTSRGLTYAPMYISADAYRTILAQDRETCGQ